MWIVKTLGRRTRNGVDRVYSVNGAFITQDLEQAVGEAMAVFKDEIAISAYTSPPNVVLPIQSMTANRDVRPQDTADYWNCTGIWARAS